MAPRGANRFTAKKRADYLEQIRGGARRGQAARQVGVSPRQVQRHSWNPDGTPTAFGAEVIEAEFEADEEVEDALRMAAISGNVTAALAWLYSRQPERWSDRRALRAEVSGPRGGAIPLEVEVTVEALMGLVHEVRSEMADPSHEPPALGSAPNAHPGPPAPLPPDPPPSGPEAAPGAPMGPS